MFLRNINVQKHAIRSQLAIFINELPLKFVMCHILSRIAPDSKMIYKTPPFQSLLYLSVSFVLLMLIRSVAVRDPV